MLKKCMFLLLAITSIAIADSGCHKKGWRLNPKPYEPVQCYCNCKQYPQTDDYRCVSCGHKRIPVDLVEKKQKPSKRL